MSSQATDPLASLGGKVQIPISDAIKHHGQLVFLDGSWWLGQRETTSRQDFETGPRIAGAHFFDIDDVCAPPNSSMNPKSLPHMMPSPKMFAAAMDSMQISNDDHLVVYGQEGCPFLHRAWFQLACMGHDFQKVHLLEGSLQSWMKADGPIETGPVATMRVEALDMKKEPSYQAVAARNVVDIEEIRRLVSNDTDESTTIVDVRSADRFYGRVEEPRAGLLRGHMPGAQNLFFLDLIDEKDKTKLKSKDMIEEVLKGKLESDILEDERRVVITCGSGATACTMAAALITAGKDPETVFVYDGSWCEWGADPSNPIVQD